MKTTSYTALGFVTLALCSAAGPAAAETALRVDQLSCEYATDPLGIDVAQPRFSWILHSERRGGMQAAYQIVVAGSAEALGADVADNKWDSGSAAETDPVGPSSGSGHVRRGGSWLDAAGSCRSAFRDSYVPGDRYSNRGLRVVSMNYERVTFAGELKRMRSTAHLYQPQGHKAYQYSGFSRKGGNPDRFDCLYVEDGWRVVADHKGPGVTTRIWTPHPPELVSNGRSWGDIRIEVDDKILFSGPANEFFVRGLLPFSDPLTTVRFLDPGHKTAEREQQGEKKWLTSYVPIPFKKRFRYMQRDVLYCNINIKALPQGMEVESYWEIQWNQVQKDIEKTAAVWTDMDVLAGSVARCARAARTVALPALETGGSSRVVVAEFKGPAIIHGVRFKTKEDAAWQGVTMEVTVDDQSGPIVQTPLDYGFGSRQQRTLALGQSRDGWRYCYLPMPFRRNCRVELVSRAAESAAIDAELFVEEEATLREDVLYLHSKANEGTFRSGVDRFERPDLPLSEFFYENGYRALDHKGRGHLVAYLDLFQCQPELDEHIYIDDERTFPDNIWNGTGHEDLFDQSWGHSPLSSPMASGGSQDFKEVNVKLFWNTPMTFRTAIRFNWEWAYKFGVPPPLDAHFASVVYWYE
jgi:hypothetical protein